MPSCLFPEVGEMWKIWRTRACSNKTEDLSGDEESLNAYNSKCQLMLPCISVDLYWKREDLRCYFDDMCAKRSHENFDFEEDDDLQSRSTASDILQVRRALVDLLKRCVLEKRFPKKCLFNKMLFAWKQKEFNGEKKPASFRIVKVLADEACDVTQWFFYMSRLHNLLQSACASVWNVSSNIR